MTFLQNKFPELTKTLQVVNRASWQETFQALWVSALRLIQRVNIILAPSILSFSVTHATRILLIHLIIFIIFLVYAGS